MIDMEGRSIFDKKFVYLEWDDTLEGKEVFIADTLPQLRLLVDMCCSLQEVSKNMIKDSSWPFVDSWGTKYAMVYYDPNYQCKIAYAQGKTIQFKSNRGSHKWKDCACAPMWAITYEYHVKPVDASSVSCSTCRHYDDNSFIDPCDKCEDDVMIHNVASGWEPKQEMKKTEHKKRRKTNRELAKWVAQGNGQVKDARYSIITSRGVVYDEGDDDELCPDGWLIRGWDETEWHEPLVEEE